MLREFDNDRAPSQVLAGSVAEKIRASLAQPYQVEVRSADGSVPTVVHHCTASIGIALFAGETLSQVDVRKYADAAMYQAKGVGHIQLPLSA
jgi:GGDEF domain-containing protein